MKRYNVTKAMGNGFFFQYTDTIRFVCLVKRDEDKVRVYDLHNEIEAFPMSGSEVVSWDKINVTVKSRPNIIFMNHDGELAFDKTFYETEFFRTIHMGVGNPSRYYALVSEDGISHYFMDVDGNVVGNRVFDSRWVVHEFDEDFAAIELRGTGIGYMDRKGNFPAWGMFFDEIKDNEFKPGFSSGLAHVMIGDCDYYVDDEGNVYDEKNMEDIRPELQENCRNRARHLDRFISATEI